MLVQLVDLILKVFDSEVFLLVLGLEEVDVLAIYFLVDEPLVAGEVRLLRFVEL